MISPTFFRDRLNGLQLFQDLSVPPLPSTIFFGEYIFFQKKRGENNHGPAAVMKGIAPLDYVDRIREG